MESTLEMSNDALVVRSYSDSVPGTTSNVLKEFRMACRDCKYYDVERVKDAGGRIRKDRVAACMWQMPEIAWPDSIKTAATSFRSVTNPNRRYMEPNEGIGCEAFAPSEPVLQP